MVRNLKDIFNSLGIDLNEIEEVSDGFHTFESLYHQRCILFAALVNTFKESSWKSKKHSDGEDCFGGGWFIVGIDTPQGQYTYHYEMDVWNMFKCKELEVAPEWDGHTDKDVERLLSLKKRRKKMIVIRKVDIVGLEPAIRGMRNPMNSWEKSDSIRNENCFQLGENDFGLMINLAKGGSVHAKYRRMIVVYADITAPLYWWKEFDTYKVGTVANSCSTMHKIHEREFELEDFSYEHLLRQPHIYNGYVPTFVLERVIDALNEFRELYINTKEKMYWWQIIQLLPSSYNQKRTVMLNYEVLSSIYRDRREHKLDEWRDFCLWIRTLPYSEIITTEVNR